MSERRYTEDHEWIDLDGEIGTVGITDFAQEQLGEVVFVEVPDVGKIVAQGDETAVVESVKAASELYAPVTGEVVEANTALADTPDMVNSDPEGDAWFYKIKLSDMAEFEALMDEDAYKAHTEA
tara:strand:+ start:342 stop:713 length:372 start_codon:yes stop_codon:yes gene_type:complete